MNTYDSGTLDKRQAQVRSADVARVARYTPLLEKDAYRRDILLPDDEMPYCLKRRAYMGSVIYVMSRLKEWVWNISTSWKKRMDERKLIDSMPYQNKPDRSPLESYWK